MRKRQRGLDTANEISHHFSYLAGLVQVQETSKTATFKRPSKLIEIYEFEGCPFCRKVCTQSAARLVQIQSKFSVHDVNSLAVIFGILAVFIVHTLENTVDERAICNEQATRHYTCSPVAYCSGLRPQKGHICQAFILVSGLLLNLSAHTRCLRAVACTSTGN